MNKFIPNFFTSLNLVCGCLAIVCAFQNPAKFSLALNFVVIAAVFDFIDGMAARLLNAHSEIGKQLDSLSDVVSFGVAPAFIIFQYMTINKTYMPDSMLNDILPYFAFVIPVFSALRLANFNIDTRQSDNFIGLPTPANGLFFASLPLMNYHFYSIFDLGKQFKFLFSNNVFMLILIIVFSYLLISEVKLIALKFKNMSWYENNVQFLFIIISLILIILFYIQAIPLIIIFYIGISVFHNLKKEKM